MEYKTVWDLTEDELDELRMARYYEMDDEQAQYYFDWDEIPNDVLFDRYDGVCFVPEDFLCNC